MKIIQITAVVEHKHEYLGAGIYSNHPEPTTYLFGLDEEGKVYQRIIGDDAWTSV